MTHFAFVIVPVIDNGNDNILMAFQIEVKEELNQCSERKKLARISSPTLEPLQPEPQSGGGFIGVISVAKRVFTHHFATPLPFTGSTFPLVYSEQ